MNLTNAQVALVNRVNAYERAIAARSRALALVEKKGALDELVRSRRYVLDFSFPADGTVPEAQTKRFVVSRDAKAFLCEEVMFSLAIVGTASGGNTAVSFTVNPRFRALQLSGTIDIRDSFRDRSWSNVPVPDALFAAQVLAPRQLSAAARLPGGTEVALTYAPTSALAATTFLGFVAQRFQLSASFVGTEVRDG